MLVLLVIAGMLGTSVVVITSFVLLRGTERLPMQILRLSLTALICFFLYRGVPAARWLTVVLCGLGALASLSSGNVALLPLGAIYLTLAGVLTLSPSVSAYLGSKRTR